MLNNRNDCLMLSFRLNNFKFYFTYLFDFAEKKVLFYFFKKTFNRRSTIKVHFNYDKQVGNIIANYELAS